MARKPIHKMLFQICAAEAVKGIFLFTAAGTLAWWQAWAYLASGLLLGAVAGVLLKDSPELVEERRSAAKKAKAWDKGLVLLLVLVLPSILYVVAGLDRRYGWTQSILPLHSILALVLLVLGTLLFLWAQKVNAFFSSFARIQSERGHQVVESGPYRYVRHPGYLGLSLGSLALPLVLASWPAMAVGALIVLLNVVRTGLEDGMLRTELTGYKDYAARVRYRLIPGIW